MRVRVAALAVVALFGVVGCSDERPRWALREPEPASPRAEFSCGAIRHSGASTPEQVYALCSEVIKLDHERAAAAAAREARDAQKTKTTKASPSVNIIGQ